MSMSEIQRMIRKEMDNSIIRLHTDLPELPELYLNWLDEGFLGEKSVVYPVAAGLIQNGLDMHDRIASQPSNGTLPLAELRRVQVDVLAGDYYSSRFYRILSRAGELTAISALCDGIIQVNRAKIRLYELLRQSTSVSWSDYRTEQIAFRSALYEPLAALVNRMDPKLWVRGVNVLACYEWLLAEWKHWQSSTQFASQWSDQLEFIWDRPLFNRYLVDETINALRWMEAELQEDSLQSLRTWLAEGIAGMAANISRHVDAGR